MQPFILKKSERFFLLILIKLFFGASWAMAQQPILEIHDWQRNLQDDFKIEKPEHANISVEDHTLHIDVTATEPESLVLSYQQPLRINRDFAIDMHLKLAQVGRDDDASGHLSKLEIQFGTGDPLNLGFLMQLIRDRYKVDEQYKIYRTDENWHHWHFEIRADKKIIFLTRDGVYQCAHNVTTLTEKNLKSEFKISVYSSSGSRTEIEIGRVKISSLAPIVERPPAIAQRLKNEILPGEWPMFRRDRRHSAHSPLKGNMNNPQIQWAYPLGGAAGSEFLDDVDGDGQPELLITISGRLSAYRLDGSLLWGIPMENTIIYGMFDLDGDGQKELVIAGGGVIQILDGRTGKVRYKCPHDAKFGVSGARIAPLNPDKPGQQIVVCNNHRHGYCLSFEDGIENGRVAWTYDYEMANFVPGIAFADMDLDGKLELVAATYGNFFVYSGIDGSVKMHLKAHTGRNYGLLVVKDIDHDGYPDIIMFADRVREHIAVIKNESGDSLRLLWDKFFEQNYPIDHKELRLFDDAVDDFDGDGRVELLYGLWDESQHPNWTTFVVDAITGDVKVKIPDTYPINSVRFFPEAPPQLIISQTKGITNRKHVDETELQIVNFAEGNVKTVTTLSKRRLLTNRSFRAFAPNIMKEFYKSESILKSKHLLNGAFFEVLDEGANTIGVEFIQGAPRNKLKHVWASKFPFEASSKNVLVAFYPDEINNQPAYLISKNDNYFYLNSEKDNLLGKFPCGGPICNPLAGRLSEDGILRILVVDPFDELLCLKPHPVKKSPSLEWKTSVSTAKLYWQIYQGQKYPVMADLDVDGLNEILISRDPDQLVLLDANGNVKKSYAFPIAPSYYTFGQFTGRDKWDLYAGYGEIVSMKSRCFHIDDDSALWQMDCGNGHPAVVDLSRQNREDILLRDLFEHRSLSGLTGRDIFPITQWCGYHIPTIIEPGEGHPIIVWTGGAYSVTAEYVNGEQLWWRPFQSGWKPAGVADVDGDGRFEIGSVTIGQLYNWPEFYPVDGPDMQFVCMDALTGEIKWEFPVKSSISPAVTADVDGDGNPEFVFGTTDGHLMALRGGNDKSTRVAFDIPLPAAVGAPIICDLFGSGHMQILVGCGDGKLYCIQ